MKGGRYMDEMIVSTFSTCSPRISVNCRAEFTTRGYFSRAYFLILSTETVVVTASIWKTDSCIPMTSLPFLAETRRFAARCLDAGLDPGGSGKELVGKGSGTVRARLAWAQFSKRKPFKRNFWRAQNFAQNVKRGEFYKRNPFKLNFWKY